MKFAVITSTYKRKDGKAPFLIKRWIETVRAQTHKDYKMYIIGDKYENFEEIEALLTPDIYFENLTKHTPERERLKGKSLWCCAGWFASNYGIIKAMADGFDYIIYLDHDEWWSEDHLKLLNEQVPFAFACTKATHISGILPRIDKVEPVIDFLPLPRGIIGASVCRNMRELPLFSRPTEDMPSDAEFWGRLRLYIEENGLRSILINKHTCFRDSQQYSKGEFK